jgi:small-conductance mechanosensitive channel
MLKSWMRDVTLAIQARSGASAALFVWICLFALALLTAFAFLCVAAYDWLALHLGSVFAGLIMAVVFALIAVIGAALSALARRRAKERAIVERAARAHAQPAWLADPKILAAAVEAGRSLGWQRILPLALLGLMAVQWNREHRQNREQRL